MLKIRLARAGAKKRPFYHLVAADSRSPRDGRFIERLGFFNPIAVGGEVRLRVDTARVDHWVSHGAQLSSRALKLVAEAREQLSLVPDSDDFAGGDESAPGGEEAAAAISGEAAEAAGSADTAGPAETADAAGSADAAGPAETVDAVASPDAAGSAETVDAAGSDEASGESSESSPEASGESSGTS